MATGRDRFIKAVSESKKNNPVEKTASGRDRYFSAIGKTDKRATAQQWLDDTKESRRANAEKSDIDVMNDSIRKNYENSPDYYRDLADKKSTEIVEEQQRMNQLEGEEYDRALMGQGNTLDRLLLEEKMLLRQAEAREYAEKYADKAAKYNEFGQAGANKTIGRMQQDSNEAWNWYLVEPTQENKRYAEGVDKTLEDYIERNHDVLQRDAALPWITEDLAQYVPQGIDQTVPTLVGAAAGLAFGAPKLGAMAGSYYYSSNNMRGAAFRELLKLGVDEETAKKLSDDEALISGLVEMAGTGLDVATLGFGKLFNAIGGKKILSSAAQKVIGALAGYGVNIVGERGEERTQSYVSTANQRRALNGEDTGLLGLIGDTAKVFYDAATGKDPEAKAQGDADADKGGIIAALAGGGTLAVNTAVETALNPPVPAAVAREIALEEKAQAKYAAAQKKNPTTAQEAATPLRMPVDETFSGEGDYLATAPFVQNPRQQTAESTYNQYADEVTSAPAPLRAVQQQETAAGRRQLEVKRIADAKSVEEAAEIVQRVQSADPVTLVETIGERGAVAIENTRAERQQVGNETFTPAFAQYYRAGMLAKNAPFSALQNQLGTEISTASQEAAYEAGREDAVRVKEAAYFGKNAGLVRDVTYYKAGVDEKTTRRLDALGKITGRQIKFKDQVKAKDGKLANAAISNGVLYIARDSTDPVMVAAIHESVHGIRETDPEAYNAINKALWDIVGDDFPAVSAKIEELKNRYGVTSQDFAEEEYTAQALGVVLSDGKVLDKFVEKNPTGVRKVLAAIKDTITKIKNFIKKNALGLDKVQMEGYEAIQKDASKLEAAFEGALERQKARAAEVAEKAEQTEGIEPTADDTARYSAMYRNQADTIGDFYDFVMANKANPKEVNKSYFTIVTPDGATLDIPFEGVLHMVAHHNTTKAQLTEIIDNIHNIEDAYRLSSTGRYNGIQIKIKISTPSGPAGALFDFDKNGRIILRTAFYGKENNLTNWIKKNDSIALSSGTSEDETVAAVFNGNRPSFTSIQQELGIVNEKYSLRYEQLLDEYGAFKPGEIPTYPDRKVPQKTSPEKYTNRFVRTAVESAHIDDEVMPEIMQMVEDEKLSHFGKSMQESFDKAEALYLASPEKAKGRWQAFIDGAEVFKNADDVLALGQYLLAKAGQEKNTQRTKQLLAEISAEAVRAGRAVRIFSLLKRIGGAGQLYYVERVVQNLQKDIDAKRKPADTKEVAKIRKEISDIQTELDGIELDLFNAQEQVDTLEKLQAAVDVEQTAKADEAAKQKDIADIERQIRNAKARTRGAKRRNTALDKVIADLNAKLKTAQDEYAAIKARRDAAITERARLTDALRSIHEKIGRAVNREYSEWWNAQLLIQELGRAKSDLEKAQSAVQRAQTKRQRMAELKKQLEKYGELEIPQELRDALAATDDPAEIEKIIDQIYTEVAGQMKVSWVDKWNSWRYLAMLGNVRTHLRNVAGNAFFAPVVMAKNTVGAIIEAGVSAATGGKIQRTKSIAGSLPFTGGEARQFAIDDYAKVEELITGGGKMNPSDIIRDRQRIFKTKIIEAARRGNFKLLEMEDRAFLKFHYTRALTQFITANKIDITSLNENDVEGFKKLSAAREYAIDEAQKATYRDASQLANALNKLSRTNKVTNLLVEALVPFKKTPINILKRGIEYSPLGLLETVTRGVRNFVRDSADNPYAANVFIDKLASGLTGTGILAVGAGLAAMGLLSGGEGDEPDDEFMKNAGAQGYSITIGDKSYSIDWIAPMSLPLFVGVEMYKQMMENDGLSVKEMFDAIVMISEPVYNLSMLQGINNTIEAVKYDDNPVTGAAINLAAGYVGQAVPTLSGQVARTADDERRTIYTDKNSDIPGTLQVIAQRTANKIPWLNKTSPVYRDAWGRAEDTGTVSSRALENFLSPGYTGRTNLSPMEKELLRLYNATSESGVLISKPTKYFTVGGQRIDLASEQYQTYVETRGQTAYTLTSQLTSSAAYRAMTDSEKAAAVKYVYEYATAIGKAKVSNYVADGWIADAIEGQKYGVTPLDFMMFRLGKSRLNSDGSLTQDEVISLIDGLNISETAKDYLYGTQYASDKNNPYYGDYVSPKKETSTTKSTGFTPRGSNGTRRNFGSSSSSGGFTPRTSSGSSGGRRSFP